MFLLVEGPRPDSETLLRRDVLSPELALVDPVLARQARARLPDPGTLNGFVKPAAGPTPILVPRQIVPAGTPGIPSRFMIVTAIASVALLLFVDLRTESAGRLPAVTRNATSPALPLAPIPAPPVKPAPKQQTSPKPRPGQGRKAPPKRPQRPTGPVARRFAWAPIASASAYHVEIFDGPTRVFASDTKRPEVTVPGHWRMDGVRRSLEAGSYRWYVWPVMAGKRATKAVVQAQLVID